MPVAIKEYLPSSLVLRTEGDIVRATSAENMASFRYGMKCFFEEGRALAKITHPNVVRVLNFFRANETVYMVMRYERGRTLQQQIQMRQDQMSERLVRHVFMHLLNGLREVHTHKLLHLDIKPANIYLRTDGSPVLLDFGAARQTLTDAASQARADVHAGIRRAGAVPRARPPRSAGPTSMASARACSLASPRSRRRPRTRGCRKTISCRRRRSGRVNIRTTFSKSSTGACASTRWSARSRCSRCRKRSATSRRNEPKVSLLGHLKRKLFHEIGAVKCTAPQAHCVRYPPEGGGQCPSGGRAGTDIMRFTIFQESRKGSRAVNQDRVAYTYSRDTLLLVVADGMGGHAGGEIAAQIAVRLFVERFQQEAKPMLKNPLTFLHESMVRAHAALGSYSTQFSMLETPRTTCVACIVQAGFAYWAHVGDSRLSVYRQGALIGQTKDHSKVQYLIDQGLIGATEAADHPDRNKIYSCLGGLVDPVIDLSNRTPLRNGDVILMCTDGLWGAIGNDELATRLTSAPILKAAPDVMRDAERRGGADGDNLSAIVVRWGPETLVDEPTTTITETLGLGEFQTQLDHTLSLSDRKGTDRDLSDDEIERAIDEIQSTIQRYRR